MGTIVFGTIPDDMDVVSIHTEAAYGDSYVTGWGFGHAFGFSDGNGWGKEVKNESSSSDDRV